ncbi:glycosyltransferase family 4 protein [Thiomicrorhabdus sp.]|uniref:glycosyltransferase family 4 protein n=1 Tax=Thiomicrorhabdus sp. TaxID=2039724 RepID=UPI0029C666DD|nr:glycosyltransferase family 4 protein [Thiomicrorhabdus sp.]
MKVLHVSSSDIKGGAARAAYRLHEALLQSGVDSQMLVQSKASGDYCVIGPASKFEKGIGLLRPAVDAFPLRKYKNRSQTFFSISWLPFSTVVKKINEIKPDIVHLHWICGGLLPISDLEKIKAPIFWTMHDMWPFTGGCHYTEGCEKFSRHCGTCPVLGSEKQKDLSYKVFEKKDKSYRDIESMHILGVSQWLIEEAKKSHLFQGKKVSWLPNPINTRVFFPVRQSIARELLCLPSDKKLVLFGAMGGDSDPRKGFDELASALNYLADDIELIIFGSKEPKNRQEFRQNTHYLGHIYDDVTLKILYSAADVMVVPSLQEAFGQTATEAMACGTPVVAFNATGLIDIVDHKVNGYLARPYESEDLARGISWVLETERAKLSGQAIDKVENNFSYDVIARLCKELYNKEVSIE